MAEVSYPVADGGAVTEYMYEKLVGQALGEGRYDNESTGLFIAPIVYGDSSGRNVKLRANTQAIVRGYRWEAGPDPVVVPLDANTSGLARMDLIVLRLDRESYTVRGAVIKGAPSSSPVIPSPLRQITETGFYDVPLAAVKVASSSTTGLPNIAAGDVTPLEMRIGPQPRVGLGSVMRNANHPVGTIWTEFDTGMVWANSGQGALLLGENSSSLTKLPVASGWAGDNIYGFRRNGWTYIQGVANLNQTTRAANDVTLLCTLPNEYRPIADMNALCMVAPGQIGRIYILASSGRVELRQFSAPFPNGGALHLQPLVFPSKGV